MVFDEPTSSVDMPIDSLIQRSIKEGFKTSTLIVVAHGLNTVPDFDYILLMSEGKMVEYDEPLELLEKRGNFWEMVQHGGETAKLEELIRRSRDCI